MGRVEQLEERVYPRLTAMQGGAVKQDLLQTKRFGKTIRRHVLEFGVLFFLILATFGIVGIYINWSATKIALFLASSMVFLIGGLLAPSALYPIWKGWMAFAEKLGAVMTFVLLSLMWVLAVTPMAFLLKVFGVKVIDRSFRSNQASYWDERKPESSDPHRMRRQF